MIINYEKSLRNADVIFSLIHCLFLILRIRKREKVIKVKLIAFHRNGH